MQVFSGLKQTQDLCRNWRDKGEIISFVPTMGCLHEGHLSLIKKAKIVSDHVVVSIFVNPLQFDNKDDLLKYPGTLDTDVRNLDDVGVDLVFTPDASSFYPEGENQVEKIELGSMFTLLEGANRPGHFAGVATVVKRLFDLIQPDSAVFGEKDFQQLLLIQQLVKKFALEIKIYGETTFREQDGLAMSSRNVRLSETERSKAPEIYRQLQIIKKAINAGEHDYAALETKAYKNLKAAGFIPDYVEIREINTLLPPQNHNDNKVVLVAAKLGDIRLIDNLRI